MCVKSNGSTICVLNINKVESICLTQRNSVLNICQMESNCPCVLCRFRSFDCGCLLLGVLLALMCALLGALAAVASGAVGRVGLFAFCKGLQSALQSLLMLLELCKLLWGCCGKPLVLLDKMQPFQCLCRGQLAGCGCCRGCCRCCW